MPLIAVLFSIDKGDDTSSKCRLLHQLRKMLALQCADLLQFWSKLTTWSSDLRPYHITRNSLRMWNTRSFLPWYLHTSTNLPNFNFLTRLVSDIIMDEVPKWKSGGCGSPDTSSGYLYITRSHGSASVVRATKQSRRKPKVDPPQRLNPINDRNTNRHMWLRRGSLHLCESSSRSAQTCRFRACVTLRTKTC